MFRRNRVEAQPIAAAFVERRHARLLLLWGWTASWPGRRDGRLHARVMSRTGEPRARRSLIGVGGARPTTIGDDAVLRGAGADVSLWLIRNRYTYAERDRRELLAAEAAVARVRVRLSGLYSEHDTLVEAVSVQLKRLEEIGEKPDAQALTLRGPAETKTPEAFVAPRRQREHAGRYAAQQAVVESLRDRLVRCERQIAETETVLAAAFDAAVARSARLRAYHERRAAVYRRAHQRAWRRRIRRGSRPVPDWQWPLYTCDATLPAPAWTTGPCPWLGRTGTR
jgi:hypothetical protein